MIYLAQSLSNGKKCLFAFLAIILFFYSATLKAEEKGHYLIDPHRLLSQPVNTGVSHLLQQTANNYAIHVHVILLNEPATEQLYQQSKQKVRALESRYPYLTSQKAAYLFFNGPTQESWIILGESIKTLEALYPILLRIESKIILPALSKGKIEKAIWEGSIALITILEDVPEITPADRSGLKVLCLGFLILGGVCWFTRPHWKAQMQKILVN